MADNESIVITEQLKNELIDLVFNEEVLWNMKCESYRTSNNKAKGEKWRAIAAILNISGNYMCDAVA